MQALVLAVLFFALIVAAGVPAGGPFNWFQWSLLVVSFAPAVLFVAFFVVVTGGEAISDWRRERRRARDRAERFKDVTLLPNGNVLRPTVDKSRMVIDRHDLPRVNNLVQVQIEGTNKFYLEGGSPDDAKDGAWAEHYRGVA